MSEGQQTGSPRKLSHLEEMLGLTDEDVQRMGLTNGNKGLILSGVIDFAKLGISSHMTGAYAGEYGEFYRGTQGKKKTTVTETTYTKSENIDEPSL